MNGGRQESAATRALPWVSTVVRLVLGGIFVAAGAIKVIDPQTSVQAVRAYELLPAGLERVVGWGLPFVEIAVGLLLIAGVFTRIVAAASGLFLMVFIAAVLSAAARGLNIDCGCFGGGGEVAAGQTSYPAEVARDLGFLLLAGWLVWRPRSRLGLQRSEEEMT
ncbi:MAG: DoxX family protein [Propionibacteriaceae bacterium]